MIHHGIIKGTNFDRVKSLEHYENCNSWRMTLKVTQKDGFIIVRFQIVAHEDDIQDYINNICQLVDGDVAQITSI